MKINPIANEYRDFTAEEYEALKQSMQQDGLLNEITLDETGAILDGRHRYRVCTELGIKVRTKTFKGTEAEQRRYSASQNDVRRHETQAERNQRQIAAAKLATAPSGTNQFREPKPSHRLSNCDSAAPSETNEFAGGEGGSNDPPSATVTIKQASEMSGITPIDIKRTRFIMANGIPKLIEAFTNGKLKPGTAWRIAKLPKAEQRKLAKKGFKEQPKKRKAKTKSQAPETKKPEPKPEPKQEPVELTHVEHINESDKTIREVFKQLRKREDWSTTRERRNAVTAFLKSMRYQVGQFEKHAAVDPDPNRTLFDQDADIPEHLSTTEFMEAWNSWWAHRKRLKLSVSSTTKRKQIKLLAIGDADQAVAIVSKAEENSWAGIPDGVWVPKYDSDLWCGRMPVNADKALRDKIQKVIDKPASGRNGKTAGHDRFRLIKDEFTDEDRLKTPDEIRKRVLGHE